MSPKTAPFDGAAAGYDASFTDTEVGRAVRSMVWRRLDAVLADGAHVLELGCGTGEDARRLAERGHRVTATDVSEAMLDRARRKIDDAGLGDRVVVSRLDLETAPEAPAPPGAPFDAVFSNFGAVNCLADRAPLATALHRWLRPGGTAALVVMGPVCLWEIGWYLAHLHPGIATRRFRGGRSAKVGGGHSVRVWYPSARRLRRELEPGFRTTGVIGIGALVPPVFAGAVVRNRPRLLDHLVRIDERWAGPLAGIADHYLLTAERVDDAG